MHTDLTWSPGTTGIVLAVLVGHADTELPHASLRM